ncbi:Predicted oxidoreductase, contains short-chain dehydrogenase (SDR) and DUF2520 domains [Desulfocicer vacuolatum DSM 3385]|uniref:Predicted oxidoreductase, contains short-chain dehydrogenase (SDR) and DUF2520 domains n=1 Tax=Desulfocicer vacuolatum DSM 3385 TaxID=1121400 RepID=A0A1W2A702_9BACT|nr:DUF2520 domain-containing protein [Desulfocicer vacuolatum]SMC56048.1 Predicted oxidoreductase, contains short-chain dehydrogenase (SDR) and DUF2520 domains [Desulfocicer vacuolatum DSM 3385]
MKPDITIIGCGRVGTALAVFLSRAGYPVTGFFSRHLESAEKAAKAAGTGKVYDTLQGAVTVADIVFITTPDQLIEGVCEELAAIEGLLDKRMVMHCSGALSSEILSAARACGADVGSIHPLQSFAPYVPGQASPFQGIHISVEGSDRAVTAGKEMAVNLGGACFTLPTHAKTLYHASAVVASNYLVTLEHFALDLLKAANLSEKEAYPILEPLITGTLNNIKNRGTQGALTGPVARGDAAVVADHLGDLEKKMPEYVALYKMMGKYTLKLAQKGGTLDKEAIQSLSKLFAQ